MTSLVLVAAVLLDSVCGEPRRFHPLVGFGNLAGRLEARLLVDGAGAPGKRLAGLLAWSLLVVAPGLGLYFLCMAIDAIWLLVPVNVGVLYFAIGNRSLAQHARSVMFPLQRGNLQEARQRVSLMVSRDTAEMDDRAATRAVLESVLENGSDSVFAPVFWFLVAGAPGALIYRLANTLDAMWGYRNARYRDFGLAAARFDDLLNWVPARLCALGYLLVGNFCNGWRSWRQQGHLTDSPNAGVVMASGAGALDIQLGGAASYHGKIHQRPPLGLGASPQPDDIERALALINRCLLLWIAVYALLEFQT